MLLVTVRKIEGEMHDDKSYIYIYIEREREKEAIRTISEKDMKRWTEGNPESQAKTAAGRRPS